MKKQDVYCLHCGVIACNFPCETQRNASCLYSLFCCVHCNVSHGLIRRNSFGITVLQQKPRNMFNQYIMIYKIPCEDLIHLAVLYFQCINQWLERDATCPMCRRPVSTIPPLTSASSHHHIRSTVYPSPLSPAITNDNDCLLLYYIFNKERKLYHGWDSSDIDSTKFQLEYFYRLKQPGSQWIRIFDR